MIKLENLVLPSPQQWEAIIRGMRNPMNSWAESDSQMSYVDEASVNQQAPHCFIVGEKDISLMKKLAKAGTDHRKFMRMIPVYIDITAPLYWWKEFDTYKVGTVANSCSTMHKIHAKEITRDDFSWENLDMESRDCLDNVIQLLNRRRDDYKFTKDKRYWDNLIQLLPSSYNQRRTIMMNYEVLANIYKSRRNHKLAEWRELCTWIEDLPYSELITGKEEE